jgi:hypothetical protein
MTMTSNARHKTGKQDALMVFGATGRPGQARHDYAKGSWGSKQADALLPDGAPSHDPVLPRRHCRRGMR